MAGASVFTPLPGTSVVVLVNTLPPPPPPPRSVDEVAVASLFFAARSCVVTAGRRSLNVTLAVCRRGVATPGVRRIDLVGDGWRRRRGEGEAGWAGARARLLRGDVDWRGDGSASLVGAGFGCTASLVWGRGMGTTGAMFSLSSSSLS